jgi:hypothetical protein
MSLVLFNSLSPQFILVTVSYDWEFPEFFFPINFHAALILF